MSEQAATPICRLDRVEKRYQMGNTEVTALRGVSLEVRPGEFLSLAGPSGSGKTTILNLIGCLDRPTAGDVYLEGQALKELSRNRLAALRNARIGFIFQSFQLIPVLTAFENVEFPLVLRGKPAGKERRAQIEALLQRVGLGDHLYRRPNELSGGQQQRVAIARALVKQPALVLADEPTANLDSTNGQAIIDLMKEMNRELGATFVFSTHDHMVMSYASRLIRLKDGTIESEEVRL